MTTFFKTDCVSGLGLATVFLLFFVNSCFSATNPNYAYNGFTWASWSHCSVTCGQGTRSRYGQTVKCQPYLPCKRTFVKQSAKCYSGRSCNGPDVEWGSWGQCSVKCGRGYRVRRGKVDCSYLRRQYPTARCYPSVIFAKMDCTGSQCTYGVTWGSWSGCSATCGGGTRTRQGVRRCTPYWYGCSTRRVSQTYVCGKDPCPTDTIPTTDSATTTVLPTTDEPTTDIFLPTTEEPTTDIFLPTTEEPTTDDVPTTTAPTTVSPTTEERTTTAIPTTIPPTTEEPTTAAAPTTVLPTTEERTTTAAPTTVLPTTEEPTTTAVPTTIRPTTEEPTTTAPPTTLLPTTEEPTTAAVPTTECKEGNRFTDACNQLCQCVDGQFVCYRIRQEIASMTKADRETFILAYKQMTVDPLTRDRYVALIDMHQTLFFDGLHDDVYFLPWHRWYLLQIENLVREINCRVTIPYWAWSLVSNDPWMQELWGDEDSSIGGDGNPENNQCVETGPFREDEYELIASSPDRCLQRSFTQPPLPNEMMVNVVLDIAAENVTEFLFGLEVSLHNRVHCQIGGTMCSIHSSNAPEFFLHHGYIDKIWEDWQQKSELHKTALYEDDSNPMASRFNPGVHLANGLAPTHLYDNENLPGNVRIRYEAPNHHRAYILSAAITSGALNADDFRSVPQVPLGAMPDGAWALFGFTKDPQRLQAAKERDEALTAVWGGTTPQLQSAIDKDLGFNVQDVVKMARDNSGNAGATE